MTIEKHMADYRGAKTVHSKNQLTAVELVFSSTVRIIGSRIELQRLADDLQKILRKEAERLEKEKQGGLF